jgi:hypothetical protein
MRPFKLILHPEGMNGALITANWRRVPFLLWAVLFISFCLSGYYSILWIDWNTAISPQEALQQSPSLAAQIDPKWKAVLINHGEVSEWPRGTSQQNPETFRSVTHLFDLYWIINLGLLFAVLALASQKKRPEG